MRVSIDESGVMTVTSETPIEAFALRSWGDQSAVRFEEQSDQPEVFIRSGKFVTVFSTERGY